MRPVSPFPQPTPKALIFSTQTQGDARRVNKPSVAHADHLIGYDFHPSVASRRYVITMTGFGDRFRRNAQVES